MSHEDTQFWLDGEPVSFQPGQTVMVAAAAAGHVLPHLCWHPELPPHGSCRLCVVEVDQRVTSACTLPARAGLQVRSRTAALAQQRQALLQMLLVEGNHFCPGCEKSGDCGLQASAYDEGLLSPHFDHFSPQRAVDASHPDVWLDRNRCILCGLCVRASEILDQKRVFALAGHGLATTLVVNSPSGQLGDSALALEDQAVAVCPVGALLPKRVGFAVPIGQRRHDRQAAPPAASDATGGEA